MFIDYLILQQTTTNLYEPIPSCKGKTCWNKRKKSLKHHVLSVLVMYSQSRVHEKAKNTLKNTYQRAKGDFIYYWGKKRVKALVVAPRELMEGPREERAWLQIVRGNSILYTVHVGFLGSPRGMIGSISHSRW